VRGGGERGQKGQSLFERANDGDGGAVGLKKMVEEKEVCVFV